MEQQRSETAHKLAQSVMQFNKLFMHFHRNDWYQSFAETACKPGAMGVLFAIKRKRDLVEVREVKVSEIHKLMKVSEISKLLRVTSPTITQFLKELEANGLIERHIDPADRRAVGIALTERGEEVARKFEDHFATTFRGLAEYLGDEQSNQLADLLGKAYNYFNEKEANMHQIQWNGDEEA